MLPKTTAPAGLEPSLSSRSHRFRKGKHFSFFNYCDPRDESSAPLSSARCSAALNNTVESKSPSLCDAMRCGAALLNFALYPNCQGNTETVELFRLFVRSVRKISSAEYSAISESKLKKQAKTARLVTSEKLFVNVFRSMSQFHECRVAPHRIASRFPSPYLGVRIESFFAKRVVQQMLL